MHVDGLCLIDGSSSSVTGCWIMRRANPWPLLSTTQSCGLLEALEIYPREAALDAQLVPDERDPGWIALIRVMADLHAGNHADLARGATSFVNLSLPGAEVPADLAHVTRVGMLSFIRQPKTEPNGPQVPAPQPS